MNPRRCRLLHTKEASQFVAKQLTICWYVHRQARIRPVRKGCATAPRSGSLAGMIASWRWAGALLAGVGAVGGCVVTGQIGYNCDPSIYEEGHLGPDGKADFCHRRDLADAGGGCAVGACTETPLHWDGPTLLWSGPAGQAPECPTGPTGIAWEGHADLVAPNECEACTCEPPTGSCTLPSTLMASTTDCGNFLGGVHKSFDAPAPWDGHCDTAAQVPAGVATSLKIEPLTLVENGCMPGPPVAAKVVSSYWATDARACHGPGFLPCLDTQSACTPIEDPPKFRVCVTHEGEHDCPSYPGAVFTEQHIFYEGAKDDRQCSACTCGPPMGSLCTAMVSVYAGGMCGGLIVDQGTVSSVSSRCVDIQPPGQALGSKSAGPMTYFPGACQPTGGDPSGVATGNDASTFCCRPGAASHPVP